MKVNECDNVMRCRYAECLPPSILEAVLISDHSDSSPYSGSMDIAFFRDNKIERLQYSYGSCSGCDEWEQAHYSDEQVRDEIEKLVILVKGADDK